MTGDSQILVRLRIGVSNRIMIFANIGSVREVPIVCGLLV